MALATATGGNAQTDDTPAIEPVVWRISHGLAPIHPVSAFFFTPFADQIEADSDGALEITFIAPEDGETPDALLSRLRAGEIDGAYLALSDLPDTFPAAEAIELPFMARKDAVRASRAAWTFARTHIGPAAPDLVLAAIHTTGDVVLHTKGRRMKSVSRFEGLVAQADTSAGREFLSLLGAELVDIPFSDVPRAMSRSRVEGTIAPWFEFASGEIVKQAQKHMEVPGDKAMLTRTFALLLRGDLLRDLDEEARTRIEDRLGAPASEMAGWAVARGNEIGVANLARQPRTNIVLAADEVALLQDVSRQQIANWLNARTAQGHPAQDWLRDFSRYMGAE